MSIGQKYQYCIVHRGDTRLEPDYSFVSIWDIDDAESLAEDAAEDFHLNHDGWEYSWPVEFAIFSESGELIGKYSVDRDYDPVFSASRINR